MICSKCNAEFERTAGKNHWCVTCRNQYGCAWSKRRTPEQKEKCCRRQRAAAAKRTAWLNSLKLAPCMDCGGKFPPCAMDFDHVRGQKLYAVGPSRMRDKDLILAEIAKCELVCANCHRVRTFARKQHKKKPTSDDGSNFLAS